MKIIKVPVIGYNIFFFDDSVKIPNDIEDFYDFISDKVPDHSELEEDFEGEIIIKLNE